jgi:hypothetical protein
MKIPRIEVEPIPYAKIMFPVGSLLDIPTGNFLNGIYGQKCLNGGVSNLFAIIGMGNTHKSTILHYIALSAASRVGPDCYLDTYDTETNVKIDRLKRLTEGIPTIDPNDNDWIRNGRWTITDSSIYKGDQWYALFKKAVNEKIKHKKEYMVDTTIVDENTNQPLKIIYPSFQEVDSISRFITTDVIKSQDENMIGEAGGNTIPMRQGLHKSRFLEEIPELATASSTYILMTAHFGEKVNMDKYSQPLKQLPTLKQNHRIKGVPPNFSYLITNCWYVEKCEQLINQNDKTILYPRAVDDKTVKGNDLWLLTLVQLRSKTGPSGYPIKIVLSQSEGVQASLSEFHFLKTSAYFGFTGNNTSYRCILYPELTLNRVNIRTMLRENGKLERAMNILSEYLQMKTMWDSRLDIKYICTPEELYEDIKAKGYDWDMILSHTRGYPTINKEDPLLELSTMDILRMRAGEYHPFWLSDDKKTVKKEFTKFLKPREN